MSEDSKSVVEGLRAKFNRLVGRAKATIFAERLLPKIVPPLGVAGLFLGASWAGVWEPLPPEARAVGVLAFAAAFLASPFMNRSGSLKVTDTDALKRLDDQVGDPSRPAQTLRDEIADSDDKVGQQIWERKLTDVWNEFSGKFKVGRFAPGISKKVYLLAAAAALSVAVTAPMAGDHRMELIQDAFVWQHPVPPLEARAWIIPPSNIEGTYQQVFDQDSNGAELVAHESSRMSLIVFGDNAVTVNGQVLEASEVITPPENSGNPDAKPSYRYDFDLAEGENDIGIDGGPSWSVDVSSDLDPTVILEQVRRNEDDPNALDIIFIPHDDHGVQDGNIILRDPTAPEGAQPLPSGQLPTIRVPSMKNN